MPATPGTLSSLFAPLIVKGTDYEANYLVNNQAAIVGELRSIEGNAVSWIEAEILGAIPRQSLAQKMAAGEFGATVKNVATEIAAQLPAADEVLVNAIETQLEALSSHFATP